MAKEGKEASMFIDWDITKFSVETHIWCTSLHKRKSERVYIKALFFSVSYLRRYFKHFIPIKDCIYNGRTLVDPGTIINNKFKEQLYRWCGIPHTNSMIHRYGYL